MIAAGIRWTLSTSDAANWRSAARRRSSSRSTRPWRRASVANSRSRSRPAAHLDRTRSWISKHQPIALPVFSLWRRTRRSSQPAGALAVSGRPRGVIAERGIEVGAVTQTAVDLIGPLGMVLGIDVRLPGDEHGLRRIGELAEDRLAAHDDQLVVTGDLRRGSNHVFELRPSHRYRTVSMIRRRSCSFSTPAKGEFWRRSRPSWLSCTIRSAMALRGRARISRHRST